MGSRPIGRPSGLLCFGCSCWNRQRDSILPPDPMSILTQTEAVPLLLALAGSFMTVYASLHCWELMLLIINSYGCASPTVLLSIAATNRSLCGGLFSVLALTACDYLLLSQLLSQGWQWDACRLVVLELQHFACQWPFSHQTFTCWVLSWAYVSTGRVLVGAAGTWCIWGLQLGIMCLAGVAYSSRYCMACTHSSHSWFNCIICSADF